jgi:DDE_Tnp_1-associated
VIDLNALPLSGERASLLEVLGALTDPRKRRGIRHKVAATLTVVVAAGLSGCGRSFRSAGDFVADLPQEALARLGARWHPVRRCYIPPDEATIRRHVKMIDADEADQLAGGWLLAQVRAGRIAAGQAAGLLVALDGKVLKGSWEELPDVKVKLFSALVHGEGVIIGQRRVPAETTEVTQVLPLLDDIAAAHVAGSGEEGDLSGVVITADALCLRRHNASIVITAPARLANPFSRSRTAGISLDFSSTATCPRTAPIPCASAATRCGAFPVLSFAPRTVLPSMAMTSRPPARTALVHSQAPRTRSSTSGLTRANARRNVDSSAAPPAAPSTASTSGPASAAHCPIAANDRDPAITAATPTASSPASGCRRPRFLRGSGTWASRSGRYWLRAAGTGEDGIGGQVSLVAGNGECENFHRSAQALPATSRHARHITRRYGTAGHSPNSRPCRIPDLHMGSWTSFLTFFLQPEIRAGPLGRGVSKVLVIL